MDGRNKWRIARSLAATIAALGGTAGLVRPADAVVITAGACLLTIELTSGGVPVVPPGSGTWNLSGGGECVVDTSISAPAIVTGSLSGEHNLISCLGSVLGGTLTLDVTWPGYGSMTGDLAVAVSAAGAGPLVTVEGMSFAAAGVFVQDPFDTKQCICDYGSSALTWIGELVFEDPVV